MHPPEAFTLDARGLGQRIAALRRANGWSQRRLAEAAGVSHGYIALLELGRLPSPGKPRLDAIARALSLPSSDALSGAAETTAPATGRPPGPTVGYPPATAGSGSTSASVASRPRTSTAATAANAPRSPQPSSLGPSPSSAGGQATDHAASLNVLGRVEQLRGVGARPLPIFRWGACGDPRDLESPPDPDRLEYPPPGRETLIGPHGFGVVVKGDSMAGRGIFEGDVVWVNPERPYGVGKVVLALVSDADGEPAGMVVKTYARTEVGDCLLSETGDGRTPVVCREFKVIGPVVGITSWRLPS
jgi:SOS-response transcriptional repressor LexA